VRRTRRKPRGSPECGWKRGGSETSTKNAGKVKAARSLRELFNLAKVNRAGDEAEALRIIVPEDRLLSSREARKELDLWGLLMEADKPKETEPYTMFNKVILIGRLGQNAEAKTAQNKREFVVLNIATQESWKNDKGDYETRTEWHRVFAWSNLSKFSRTLQKGQLITLEGTLRYGEYEEEIHGLTVKHRAAEIHALSMKRLSKVETADDPSDGADDE
jgi:single-strand DNA-binding protein